MTLQHLEAALESSCAALVALEALADRVRILSGELQRIEIQTRATIACLRDAVTQLRPAPDPESRALAFGFVLGRDPLASPDRQVKPLRTA